ncbi:hypothetical protein C8R43DRAFT_1106586 [Mycena crocata]|nr:hypothetical protein C8R43DRAFT_1106586 [Mycena crocata]
MAPAISDEEEELSEDERQYRIEYKQWLDDEFLDKKRNRWKAASARYYKKHPEIRSKKRAQMAELRHFSAAKKLAKRRWDPPKKTKPTEKTITEQQLLEEVSTNISLDLTPDEIGALRPTAFTHNDLLEMFDSAMNEEANRQSPEQSAAQLIESPRSLEQDAIMSLTRLYTQNSNAYIFPSDLPPSDDPGTSSPSDDAGDGWDLIAPDYDSSPGIEKDRDSSDSIILARAEWYMKRRPKGEKSEEFQARFRSLWFVLWHGASPSEEKDSELKVIFKFRLTHRIEDLFVLILRLAVTGLQRNTFSMAPNSWTTAEQAAFFARELPLYIAAKENSKKVPLTRYWTRMEEDFFVRWPEEAVLGLPITGPGVHHTSDQLKLLGDATEKRKKQLVAYLRYQDRLVTQGKGDTSTSAPRGQKATGLFKVLQADKPTRNLQVVEMYQKLYRPKIKEEVLKRGYGDMNEEAAEAVRALPGSSGSALLSAEALRIVEAEEDRQTVERMQKARADRMSMWRATANELWEEESEDVRREVEDATFKAKQERAALKEGPSDSGERTPEQYQHGIDQIPAVYTKVHDATMEEAGWFGLTLLGGPMPRRGGGISTKTICFGRTPNGHTFETSHPEFEAIRNSLVKFLKRSFSHEVRDARGLPQAGEAIATEPFNGLLTMDEEVEQDTPIPQPAMDRVPKRIRKPKRPTAATPSRAISSTPAASIAFINPGAAAASADSDASFFSNSGPEDSGMASDVFSPSFSGEPAPAVHDVNPSSNDTDGLHRIWGGMPPPTSPRTAGAIANFERGGPTPAAGLENIDPTLVGGSMQPAYPTPRPMHSGASFQCNRVVGGSPGRAQSTVVVGGFRFPALSHIQPFQNPPTHPSVSSSSTLFQFAAAATSSVLSSPPASARDPVTTPTTTTSLPASLPSTPSPYPLHPAAPLSSPSTQTVFTAVVAGVTAAGTSASPHPVEAAPSVPQYIQSRPMANAPKGHPLAAKKAVTSRASTKKRPPTRRNAVAARGGDGDDAPVIASEEDEAVLPPAKRQRGRPRTNAAPNAPFELAVPPPPPPPPAMTAAAREESMRIRAEAAELRRQAKEVRATEKVMEEREKEARRLQENLRNPDGNHPLFVTAARPRRNAVAKDYEGNPISLPVKLTRAKQLASRNAPSENALLARTSKRAAPAEAESANRSKRAPNSSTEYVDCFGKMYKCCRMGSMVAAQQQAIIPSAILQHSVTPGSTCRKGHAEIQQEVKLLEMQPR